MMDRPTLATRFRTLLPLKLFLLVAITAAIALPYFGLQRATLFPVTIVPELALDRATPFVPATTYVYFSMYLFLALPAMFMVRKDELVRFSACILTITAIAAVIFILWPSGVVRPPPPDPLDPAYAIILATDVPINACPSLHAAFALLAALCLDRMLGRRQPFARLLIWAWALAIMISTLTTKQHVLLDLIAGSALAVAAFLWIYADQIEQSAPSGQPWTSDQAESASTARTLVSTGLESAIDELRRFHLGKRLAELAFFPALWLAGASLTLTLGQSRDVTGWLAWGSGIFLSAVALNAFVLLLHEGMHYVLFRNPLANRWVAALAGMPLLISFTAYQVMHLRHHTYLGDPRDPDEYQNHTRSRRLLWMMHFLRLALGAFAYLLLIPRLAWRHGSTRDRRHLVEEYAVMACLVTAAISLVPGHALLAGWVLPAIIVGFMTNIRGFTQHGITDPADPYLASRSIQANPVVAFCLFYENYHLEHHFFPEIPSYHLPALHRLIWPRLPRAVTGRSYLAFVGRFLRASLTRDETPIGRIEHSPAISELQEATP